MGIKLKVTDDDKKHLSNFSIEAMVLNNLLGERKRFMDAKASEILIANGLDPKLYGVNFNPKEDKWEAILKPGALTIPAPGTNLNKIKTN